LKEFCGPGKRISPEAMKAVLNKIELAKKVGDAKQKKAYKRQ
jgi:hypothetical protein